MNPQVKRYLNTLPKEFKPIVDQANKYYSFDNKAGVRTDGAIQIFNRTWVAPENYGLLLFPPAESKIIDKFEKQNKLKTSCPKKAIPKGTKGRESRKNNGFITLSLLSCPTNGLNR